MSEKCKTCTNFRPFKTGDHPHGNCAVLPGLIGVRSCDYFAVPGNFGCVGHVPKPEKPEVVDLWVERRLPTGKLTIELYSELQQSDWDAVQAFMQDVRIARKTEKRPG